MRGFLAQYNAHASQPCMRAFFGRRLRCTAVPSGMKYHCGFLARNPLENRAQPFAFGFYKEESGDRNQILPLQLGS